MTIFTDACAYGAPQCREGRGCNTISTILLAATVAAAVLTQATYVRAATKFDGNWSLVVYTRSGPCDASYRLAGQIVNGAVVHGGGGVQVYGRVRNGAAS